MLCYGWGLFWLICEDLPLFGREFGAETTNKHCLEAFLEEQADFQSNAWDWARKVLSGFLRRLLMDIGCGVTAAIDEAVQ